MDAQSFTELLRSRGQSLQRFMRQKILSDSFHLRSQAFDANAEAQATEMCEPLLSTTQNEVEDVLREKYGIKHDFLVTCLVPYQLGVNIILSKMPQRIRAECVAELRQDELNRKEKRTPQKPHVWIDWKERDVYVSTGTAYLKRISRHRRKRVPIFSVMGHVNHGKTTLLDALQQSNLRDDEPHSITQSVRAFTACSPENTHELFTFIDTPGHRVFAESRFHAQLISDFIILIISVVEGIQSQTHEIIKVALNVDRPLIVVLNKLDLLSDVLTADRCVRRILSELEEIGLEVTLVRKPKDVASRQSPSSSKPADSVMAKSECVGEQAFFAPMKSIDPEYKGSRRKPVLNLRRKCYGVCISAQKRIRLSLLWQVLRACVNACPPMCHSTSAGFTEHNCAVQAVVLESSKHLFDEEGFRRNRSRQLLQRRLDGKQARHEQRLEKQSIMTRVLSMYNRSKHKASSHNRTSTSSLVISVIVKEGVVRQGMHFVADQSEGKVDHMIDFWGNPIAEATPGMAVTLIDMQSISGCPGAGIHVLSTVSESARLHIHAYRQVLQWFVECFPTKLHYLKPRGMDVSFAHLGDYGQLQNTECLEYQLLYGRPPQTKSERPALSSGVPAAEAAPEIEMTLAEYLLQKNQAEDASSGESRASAFLLEGTSGKRLHQAIVKPTDEEVLENTWRALQLTERLESQRAYEEFLSQCIQVGVLVKVDSWHTARMLHRDIPRLGTKKVALHVLGARFGGLCVDDILFFAQAVKIIICYRTPQVASRDLDRYIEASDLWVLQTDHFSDVIAFLKWCAVATHKEQAAGTEDDDTGRGAANSSYYMVLNQQKKNPEASASQMPPTQAPRAAQDGGKKPRKIRLLRFDEHTGGN